MIHEPAPPRAYAGRPSCGFVRAGELRWRRLVALAQICLSNLFDECSPQLTLEKTLPPPLFIIHSPVAPHVEFIFCNLEAAKWLHCKRGPA